MILMHSHPHLWALKLKTEFEDKSSPNTCIRVHLETSQCTTQILNMKALHLEFLDYANHRIFLT